MKVDGVEKIIVSMINDCDMVGIHIVLATNSYTEDYFSKEFIKNIKYKITFDLVSKADASFIGIREAEDLKVPGEAIVTSKKQRLRYKIQTPYISDEDIMRVINYYLDKDKVMV